MAGEVLHQAKSAAPPRRRAFVPPAPARPDARVRRIVSGRGQDGEGLPLRLAVYTSADPLAPYTVLREVSPGIWSGFDRVARTRTFASPSPVPASPAASESDTDTDFDTESGLVAAVLPVRSLVRPALPQPGGADLRRRLWPLVSAANADPEAVAGVIRDELIGRWAAQNRRLLAGSVLIRLLAPEDVDAGLAVLGAEAGHQNVLSFEIDGEPVESSDGSLPVILLDLLGSNSLERLAQEVGDQATVIATAGDLLVASTALVADERRFWAAVREEPDSFSRKDVDEHFGLFSLQLGQDGPVKAPLLLELGFFLGRHPEFSSELGSTAAELRELSRQTWTDYLSYRDRFDARLRDPEMRTFREGVDRSFDTAAEQLRDVGPISGGLAYGVAGLGEGMYWVANTLSFGYPDARHAGVQAFKRGEISYRQLEDLTDAAAARGAAVGLVNLALTAVTAGLAGPFLGAGATLGSRILFAGVTSGLSSVASDNFGNAITDAGRFQDPVQQAIWGKARRSAEQIALSGAVSFGLGAASVPARLALGKLVAWVRRPPAPGLPAGAPELSAPPGWTAEQITEDTVRYTHPDVPGEVRVGPARPSAEPAGGPSAPAAETAPARPTSPAAPASEAVSPAPPAVAVSEAAPGITSRPAPPVPAPAAPAPAAPVPATPVAPAAGAPPLVWINPRSNVFHRPGSRWYGRTPGGSAVTEAAALAAGYRPAGQLPPTGVLRVERPPLGENRLVIHSRLGTGQARRGYEKQMASAAAYSIDEIATYERAHSQGAGVGAEAAEAIRLAPRIVNQELQKEGVEKTLRELVATLPAGTELRLTTITTTHPGTLRLKEIQYVLRAVRDGRPQAVLFEAGIEVGLSGRAVTTVELRGGLLGDVQ